MTVDEKHLIRWRGRVEGPLSLQEIGVRLDNGKVGLLTEIQVRGQWITLRDFFHSQSVKKEDEPSTDENPNSSESTNYQSTAPPEVPPFEAEESRRRPPFVAIGIAVLVFALMTFFGFAMHLRVKRNTKNQASGIASATVTNPLPEHGGSSAGTNAVAVAHVTSNSVPVGAPNPSNLPASTPASATAETNATAATETAMLPPLPENEPRFFRLKNKTNYFGTIIFVDAKGALIKLSSNQYTPRLPLELFDEEVLAREPKVLAFRKSQQKAKEAAIQAQAAATAAAAKAKADEEAAASKLAEYRKQQDKLLDASIQVYGWKVVTKGHLKAWGSNASIGEIFDVVAPGAQWSAGKLAAYEDERYTHYLVYAKWTNDKIQPVEMQYLVTADGSDFHLHGCFVSGKKMADVPFLLTVKDIWNQKQ